MSLLSPLRWLLLCGLLLCGLLLCGLKSNATSDATDLEVDRLKAQNAQLRDELNQERNLFTACQDFDTQLMRLSAFARHNIPADLSKVHVLYLASGVDLAHAAALFPAASSFTLVAKMPASGHCTFSTSKYCTERRKNTARGYRIHECAKNGATVSATMNQLFRETGVEPALTDSLRRAGHQGLHTSISRLAGELDMLTIKARHTTLYYIVADFLNATHRAMIGGHVQSMRGHRVSLVKGAGDVFFKRGVGLSEGTATSQPCASFTT